MTLVESKLPYLLGQSLARATPTMQGFKITWWTYGLQAEVSKRATSSAIRVCPLFGFSLRPAPLSFELRNLGGRPVPFSGLRKKSNAGISISWPPAGVRLHSLLLLRPGLDGSEETVVQ